MLLIKLVKRNMLVYARDRANIFFSLLSMIIIIGLMVVFLGKMNADNIVDLLKEYGGARDVAADLSNAQQLIILWTLAGIVVVNSVTITLSMVGIMVEDEAHKKLSSFYVSPVNRMIFVLGYVTAAIIMGIIMCVMTFVLGEAYIVVTGGDLLAPTQMLQVLLYIVLNVFTSATLVFLIANFVHSLSAFSGLSTVIGTIVGFIAGIYLPIGMLPEKVQMVLKGFPLFYGCSFLRELFTKDILTKTFSNCPEQLVSSYKEFMGITITFQDSIISNEVKMAILAISGIIFIGVSIILQRSRNVMNR
jgi:multidrug/hemolysin transport system permease protein